MGEVLYSVIERILDDFRRDGGGVIPEDLIYELEETSYQFICGNKQMQNVESLRELRSYLNSVWRSRSYYELEPETIFNMGRIFNIIDMLKMSEERLANDIKIEEDAKKYINRYRVFKYINQVRGITHNDLAERAGLSSSALSQFLGKIEYDKYVLYRKSGRCKYYYLTDYGRELLTLMEEEKRREREETKRKLHETITRSHINSGMNLFSNHINRVSNDFFFLSYMPQDDLYKMIGVDDSGCLDVYSCAQYDEIVGMIQGDSKYVDDKVGMRA